MRNEEINTIIHAIGADFGSDFDLSKMNYNKVIIMTDADTDGAHIQVLLLTFFLRFMRPLIEAGKLYIALPPLYRISRKRGKKEDAKYLWTDDDLNQVEDLSSYRIQRFKGLEKWIVTSFGIQQWILKLDQLFKYAWWYFEADQKLLP